MEGSSDTGSTPGAAPTASPSTMTASNGKSDGAQSSGSPPDAAREAAPRGTRAAMRETWERERAKRAAGGTDAGDATRDATGRFVAKAEQQPEAEASKAPPTEKSASRPKPEGGQPDKGEGSPDDERIPKAAFTERLARERKKQEAIAQRAESAELRAAKAEEAFRIMAAKSEALEKALREGRPFDPRDDQLSRYELAEEARKAAERVDAEFAQRREREKREALEEQQTIEAREAARAEIKAALAKYPLAAFQEVVDHMVNNPSDDLEAAAKRIHESREAQGWIRKPTEPPAPPAPTLSRATSSGPATSAPVGHGRDALLATFMREESKRKTMGR